ncbi:uncharacterized protein LOC126984264 [Eriocheir sinensis]|uniref:uncharacterized protein LOC126984264 n=1 Tax=Eriocheir sinensis TaxID=95602 RepID=UPI0021C7AEB1|nr:uncharacterized protein LOC126984264 [Eriocheir sinensis]
MSGTFHPRVSLGNFSLCLMAPSGSSARLVLWSCGYAISEGVRSGRFTPTMFRSFTRTLLDSMTPLTSGVPTLSLTNKYKDRWMIHYQWFIPLRSRFPCRLLLLPSPPHRLLLPHHLKFSRLLPSLRQIVHCPPTRYLPLSPTSWSALLSIVNDRRTDTPYHFRSWVLPSREQPIRPGLVFSPVFKMLLTGRYYVVPVVIQTDEIQRPLINVANLAAEVSWSIEHMNQSFPTVGLLRRTLDSFHFEFNKLFKDLNNFLAAMSGRDGSPFKTRQRRGAVDFVGSVESLLFGTATQAQIDVIHEKLSHLHTLSSEERRQLNLHTEVLNATVRDLRHLHSAISRLESASALASAIIRQFSLRTLQIEGEMRILETILLIQLALSDLNHDTLNLKLGLQQMSQTQVSPLIIPNDVLLRVLRNASLHYPGLLFPAAHEYLALYRDVSRVISKGALSLGTLHFYLQIPMKGDPSDVFDVFKMDALPFHLDDTPYFLHTDTLSTYLAVSEDRTHYMLLDSLDRCTKHRLLYICPPVAPVYSISVRRCEIALFLARPDALSLCSKSLLRTFPPVFLPSPAGWVFSTDVPQVVTMVCPDSHVTKYRQTLNGTGLLTVGMGCSANSDAFSLPASATLDGAEPLTIHRAPFHVGRGVVESLLAVHPSLGRPSPPAPPVASTGPPLDLSPTLRLLEESVPGSPAGAAAYPWWGWLLFGFSAAGLLLFACGLAWLFLLRPRLLRTSRPVTPSPSWSEMVVRPAARFLPRGSGVL